LLVVKKYFQISFACKCSLVKVVFVLVLFIFYHLPFTLYSASKNGLTLKSGFGVVQGHSKLRGSIDHARLFIDPPL